MSITDDGSRVAALGTDGDKVVLLFEDQELQNYSDRNVGFPLSLSGDGKVIAHSLLRTEDRRGCIVVNGVRGPEFDSVGHPKVSRDGRVVAFRVERDGKHAIRVGDREGPLFDYVSDPVVSADGSKVVYSAENEGDTLIVSGDRRTLVKDNVSNIFISDDGRRVGWVASESKPQGGSRLRVVFEGSAGEAYGLVGKPVVSPVTPLVAYGAEEAGRKYVVIGDRKVETPDRISDVSFSPDGRRVGYGARIGRELWWKVIEVH